MKNGRVVGTARIDDVSKEEVLGMIILGKCPPTALSGPGAVEPSRPAATVPGAAL
jgi:D-xylose transport system ATP-binding protein